MSIPCCLSLGDVLVTKNPCLHPGDLRRLTAVDIPALRPFIRDCIVFPIHGSRPHPNEIAGSDLDGDQYWVYWGDELTVKQLASPLAYTPAPKILVPQVTPDLIVNHVLETLCSQTVGSICNTHACIADQRPNGTHSEECRQLAELFPRAVDSVKTGEQIDMTRVKELKKEWCEKYPTWMAKKDLPGYQSNSINGCLFTKASSSYSLKRYKYIIHGYENVVAPTVLDMNSIDDDNQPRNVGNISESNWYRYFIERMSSNYLRSFLSNMVSCPLLS